MDREKTRFSLIPAKPLTLLAEALTRGAEKHGEAGWEDREPVDYFDAGMRHAWAWKCGESRDPELGIPHLVLAAGNFLLAAAIEILDEEDPMDFQDEDCIYGTGGEVIPLFGAKVPAGEAADLFEAAQALEETFPAKEPQEEGPKPGDRYRIPETYNGMLEEAELGSYAHPPAEVVVLKERLGPHESRWYQAWATQGHGLVFPEFMEKCPEFMPGDKVKS